MSTQEFRSEKGVVEYEPANDRINATPGEGTKHSVGGMGMTGGVPPNIQINPKEGSDSHRGKTTPSLDWPRGNYHAIQLPTLVDYCRHYADSVTAAQPAFTHVTDQPGNHERLSFAELDVRARAIAAEIQKRGGTGHPVLVVQDPGVDYAASLFGCLYARAIAVPVYPPQMLRLQQTLPRLQAMIRNAGARCMLSSRGIIGDQLHSMWQMPNSMAIAVDEIDVDAASDWDGILPRADDVAILQYTSGSTGNPRGVVLPHRVLLSNLNAVIEHYHFEGANSVQWVPPYHDMGLIGGIFVPIYRGVEAVVISPVDFVRNPLLWLQCIDHYNGTSNGSPNFGYDLCVRRIKDADCDAVGLDLSSWKVAIAGAEPVRASTLRRFIEKFSPYGFAAESFCPAFGMAETTVVATGKPLGELYRTVTIDSAKLQTGQMVEVGSSTANPTNPSSAATHHVATQELVSSGVPVEGMAFEIVDPETCCRVPDGKIGEIWFRGDSVATGYWNDPEATSRTFGAKIKAERIEAAEDADEHAAHAYLRTGDLGARMDGELFVTGRLKELIIVGGRNLYPHDVEEVVQSVSEAFRSDTGTAFSIDTGESEELVIVQELWRPKKFDANELLPAIVAAVAASMQVTPYAVVLVRSGSLPKTSSGKLRRNDTKNGFLNGELNEWARWESTGRITSSDQQFEAPQTETETRIAEIWSRLLQEDKVGRRDDFFHLGGRSLLVAQMLTEVAEAIGVDAGMSTLFRHPRLNDFATAVDSLLATSQDSVAGMAVMASGVIGGNTLVDQGLSDQDSGVDDPTGEKLYPLSDAQRRFWLLDQMGQTNAFVYVPVTIRLAGKLDASRLQAAFNALVAKHPMLRSRVIEKDGQAFQTIDSEVSVRIGQSEPSVDIERSPMFQVLVHDESKGTSRIEMRFHHFICDAISLEVLLADLKSFLSDGCMTDGFEKEIPYVRYAAWDQCDQRQASLESGLAYWRDRLNEMPSELNLPQRSLTGLGGASDDASNTWKAKVPRSVSAAIQQLATRHGMTASMVYLTVYQSVLARYGDKDDFAITVPTSNRPASGLNHTVGCFVNPILYRAQVDPSQTVVQSLKLTRDRLLADLDHGSVPLQQVVAATTTTRNGTRLPLSQIMFLYQPATAGLGSLGGIAVQEIETDYSAVTAYDISLIVDPRNLTDEEDEITMVAGDTMDLCVASELFGSFRSALGRLAGELDDEARVHQFLETSLFDTKEVTSQSLDGIVARIHQHSEATPAKIAVTDDRNSISYRELWDASDRVAAALVGRGIEPSDLVGVELPRSSDLLVALVGIWKTRCAYLPLEASLPEQRREQILADANPALLIDADCFQTMMASGEQENGVGPLLCEAPIGLVPGKRGPTPFSPPLFCPLPNDLAYVMYTSGSTGQPKGVAIEHHSVSNLLNSFSHSPGFDSNDSMLAVTTVTFDISVLELFLPLWAGGSVRITAHRISDEPEMVASVIDEFRPTHIQSTPSAYRMLLSTKWSPHCDATLLCGGEPLMPDVAEELLAHTDSLWNVYGPTETTVWSTVKQVLSSDSITIGRPIANTPCRVLDRHGLDVPAGVAGELHIGGLGVARGYFNNEFQTAERFVELDQDRFYRTGDQVRVRPDGDFEFLARNDRQVKIRGFRVELDEIESALQRCQRVDRAAVVLRGASVHSQQLIAFCAVSADATAQSASADVIQAELSRYLPDYMIPSLVELMPELPQTAAGKTDYRALPESFDRTQNQRNDPPQTPIEQALAEAWCEILERDKVGRHEHFFDLGGNSLMAAQLFARLRERFQVELRLSEIYQRPTIAELAEAIVHNQTETRADDLDDLLAQLDNISEDEALRALEQES